MKNAENYVSKENKIMVFYNVLYPFFYMPNFQESKNILYTALYNWMKIEVSFSQPESHIKSSDNTTHIFRNIYPFIWV